MKYNLFLDDIREPKDVTWIKLPEVDWFIVRNYKEFVDSIKKKGLPQMVSFDHDLAPEHYAFNNSNNSDEPTGYDCAKWLVEFCQCHHKQFPQYYIHSMNPAGVKNIDSYIKSYKKVVEK
jgi:hypothetical protein